MTTASITPASRWPRIIDDWRRGWRMLTVHVATAACLFGALPADQQAALLNALGVPPERLPLALGLAFLVARLIKQPALSSGAPPAASEAGAQAPGQAGQA